MERLWPLLLVFIACADTGAETAGGSGGAEAGADATSSSGGSSGSSSADGSSEASTSGGPDAADAGRTIGPECTYVVATDGANTNPGTVSQPFASLAHARDVVRTVNGNMLADITVCLRAGDYVLAASDCSYASGTPIPAGFCLTEQDSGSNGHTIRYRNYDAMGSARLLGGAPVTGWTLYAGSVYRAPFSGQPVNELYENGVRAVKARTPNVNAGYGITTTAQGPYLKTTGYVCDAGGQACCPGSSAQSCASHVKMQYAPRISQRPRGHRSATVTSRRRFSPVASKEARGRTGTGATIWIP
jgi:hypothetical protein